MVEVAAALMLLCFVLCVTGNSGAGEMKGLPWSSTERKLKSVSVALVSVCRSYQNVRWSTSLHCCYNVGRENGTLVLWSSWAQRFVSRAFFFLILEVEGKCIKQARLHNSVICLITTRSSNWVMRRVVRSNCNACLYLVYKFTMPTVITCSIRRESAWPGRKKKSWKTKGSLPFKCTALPVW